MSTTTTTPRAAGTERGIALATSAAPVVTGLLAPFLDGGAAAAADCGFVAATAFTAANYMNRIPQDVIEQLPAGDIVRAHAGPMFLSAITSGMAVSMGTVLGPAGADTLMAGVLTVPSVPGIVSLGWWAAVALVPYKLRRVFGRKVLRMEADAGGELPVVPTDADDVRRKWGVFISDPDCGKHKHQVLEDVFVYVDQTGKIIRWTGRILAPAGSSVTVAEASVSSVYQVPAAWIGMEPGGHAGEVLISVDYKAPVELDPDTLEGAWKKRVARTGGVMPKTHLEGVTDDPNTGGKAAWICADEDLDILKHPDLAELAGALRTSPLLISYEKRPNNPRKAIIRMMDENPLEKGHAFQGLDTLKTTSGWFPIGKIVSGHPAKMPFFDPVLGALHVVVAGTTGSGKGGAIQLVCLGYHANGSAILYADPKGSSNPAIPKMAAYSGLRQHGALGALRLSYHVLVHRREEAAKYDLKNFQPSTLRPWCPTVLDEAGQMLAPGQPNRKESAFIVKAGASLGRSYGMPWAVINQVINLDQLGGEQAIRANLIKGGVWIILRTDSDQVGLSDLPEGFEGIDPAQIPAVWPTEDESLIYDPDMPENDPRRTFGLGFLAVPGGRAGMMRTDVLEDATPHIRPELVAAPEDVPWWGDEDRMEELANTPLPGFEEDGNGPDEDGGPRYTSGVDLPKKELSADEKIVRALRENADPLHVEALNGGDLAPDSYEITYLDKAALTADTGLAGSTLDNALTRLTKTAKIHRQIKDGTVVRGMYGLGPAPATSEGDHDVCAA